MSTKLARFKAFVRGGYGEWVKFPKCASMCPSPTRHRYARHLLMNGIPINYLSRWLGTHRFRLIYLELVADPKLGGCAVILDSA